MKKQKLAVLLTTTFLSAVMLTGCGGSAGDNGETNGSKAQTEASKDGGSDKKGNESDEDQKKKELVWKKVSIVQYVSGKSGDEVMEEQAARREEATYDEKGNLLTTIATVEKGAEELYNPQYYAYKWEDSYDAEGREIENRLYGPDGNLKMITKTEYSADGQTVTKTYYDKDGNPGTDSMGRPKRVYEYYDKERTQQKAYYLYKTVEGSAEPFLDEEEHYDEYGNTTLDIYYYQNGTKSEARRDYTYDEHGAKLTYDRYWNDVLTDHEEYAVFYNDKTEEWESQATVSVTYSSDTGIEEERTVSTYDEKGQLTSSHTTTGADQAFKYEAVCEFDANGTLVSATYYKDEEHTLVDNRKLMEYDAQGNPIKVTEEVYSYEGELYKVILKEYDAQGRLLKHQEKYEEDNYYSIWKEYTYEGDNKEYKTYKDYYHDVLEEEYKINYDENGNQLENFQYQYLYDDETGEKIGETVIRSVYEWKAFEVK